MWKNLVRVLELLARVGTPHSAKLFSLSVVCEMEVARRLSTSVCSCSYAPCCLPRPAHGTRQALCWRLPRRRERRHQSSQAEPGEGRGGGGLDSSREVAVPWEQRPVNELAQLRESWLFSWVSSCLSLLRFCNLCTGLQLRILVGLVSA